MNSRRSFLKSLAMVPAALAGAVAVAKSAPKLDLDEMFDLAYKIKKHRATYWTQVSRYSVCYSDEYIEALKKLDGSGIQFY
jgi:predicted P-loop ATPase